MGTTVKVGIMICNRYQTCAGGKCFRALQNREGAFAAYEGQEVEMVGYTTCGGCPGGNVEYSPGEMKKNGADVIHIATCFLVGYPPCDRIAYFRDYIQNRYEVKVVVGTHPIPQTYYEQHSALATWDTPQWQELISMVITDEKTRRAYN